MIENGAVYFITLSVISFFLAVLCIVAIGGFLVLVRRSFNNGDATQISLSSDSTELSDNG